MNSFYAIAATFCLAGAVVTAQAQPPTGQQPTTDRPTTPPPSSQQTSSAMAGNKVTYVGCIKAGTTTDTWVLENAEAQKGGTTGSRAVGTSGGSTTTLTLDPAATVNLKAHANHKVEITGMMSAQSSAITAAAPKGGEAEAGVTGPTDAKGETGTPGVAGAAGGTVTTGAAGARPSGHRFSVESLKMVSATCP
jgi:hypothetical protein